MNFGSRKKRGTMASKCVSVSLLANIKNNTHPASLHSYSEDSNRQHTTSFTANMLRNTDLLLLFRLKRIKSGISSSEHVSLVSTFSLQSCNSVVMHSQSKHTSLYEVNTILEHPFQTERQTFSLDRRHPQRKLSDNHKHPRP